MSVARPIPVFRPTAEEFADFAGYVTSIEPIAEQFGIAKVVPPEGWRARSSSYDDLHIEIPCPIRQFVHGKQGVYQVVNVMEKPMSLAQFKQAAEDQFAKCFPKSKREGSDPEKFDMEELERRFWKNLTFHAPLYGADMLGSLFEDDGPDHAAAADATGDGHNAAEGKVGEEEEEKEEEEEFIDVEKEESDSAATSTAAATTTTTTSAATTSPNKRKREATAGAGGQQGERRHHAWNLAHLDTLLSQRLGKLLPGVTSPYLYFGMWKSLFACHTEDMDLYSINYLHFGKPKIWYGVPSAQKHRVEQVARLHFPMQFKECSEFLRHKSSMFSPNVLKTGNVSLTHAVQQPGEFIITFPGAYHFGFNSGFNCAEAVNFALERWLHFGKKAKPCACVADSVRIDVGLFIGMVANGEEVKPEDITVSPSKKAKTEATSKNASPTKSRVAKRTNRKSKAAASPSTDSPVRTMMGARSMGIVTNRMTMTPPIDIPEPSEFVEETLDDEEAVSVFSDDEVRSGDEGDGGEYLEGKKKKKKKTKTKTKKSHKRTENKSNDNNPKREPNPNKQKQPAENMKFKKVAPNKATQSPTPSVQTTNTKPTGTETSASDTQVKSANKRPAKRRSSKSNKRRTKQLDVPKSAEETSMSTREYKGLKITIRLPRPSGNFRPSDQLGLSGQQLTRDANQPTQHIPNQQSAWSAETNQRYGHRAEAGSGMTDLPHHLTARPPVPQPLQVPYFFPFTADAARFRTPYSHVMPTAQPTGVSLSQDPYNGNALPLPPVISEISSTTDTHNSTLDSHRKKLLELREKQQQLQQRRQEKQLQLQQLNEYIQAQRQLHQTKPAFGAPLQATTSLTYGVGLPSGMALPLPAGTNSAAYLSSSTPQLFTAPVLPGIDRPTTTSPDGGKSKLVPILPNPPSAPLSSQCVPRPSTIAPSSSIPLPPSPITPTTFPIIS